MPLAFSPAAVTMRSSAALLLPADTVPTDTPPASNSPAVTQASRRIGLNGSRTSSSTVPSPDPAPLSASGEISAGQSSSLSAETNASWGTSTRPIDFIRFLPSFCFSNSLCLRVMSPP